MKQSSTLLALLASFVCALTAHAWHRDDYEPTSELPEVRASEPLPEPLKFRIWGWISSAYSTWLTVRNVCEAERCTERLEFGVLHSPPVFMSDNCEPAIGPVLSETIRRFRPNRGTVTSVRFIEPGCLYRGSIRKDWWRRVDLGVYEVRVQRSEDLVDLYCVWVQMHGRYRADFHRDVSAEQVCRPGAGQIRSCPAYLELPLSSRRWVAEP